CAADSMCLCNSGSWRAGDANIRQPTKQRGDGIRRRENAISSKRERVGDETCLLTFVPGERANSRAGAGFTACVGDLGAEKRSESRFDKSPCPHVLRFFLAPDELGAFWKRLEHFTQPFFREWIKLLNANKHCVVDFAFAAILQQIVIDL